MIVFNFSLGPVCTMYAAELVDNYTPIVCSLRSITFLVSMCTNYIIYEVGIGQLFLMFGMLSLVAHFFLKDRVRETKGKSKPEIYDMFESGLTEEEPDEKALTI